MEDLQNIIHINNDDSVIDIINKISIADGSFITLLIPEDVIILRDVVNLKILQKKADELGKEISISKLDTVGDVIQPTVDNITDIDTTDKQSSVLRRDSKNRRQIKRTGGKKIVSDMVQKNNTVDLRLHNTSKSIRPKEGDFKEPEVQDLSFKEEYYENTAVNEYDDVTTLKTIDDNFWQPQVEPVESLQDSDVVLHDNIHSSVDFSNDSIDDTINISAVVEPKKKHFTCPRFVLPSLSSYLFSFFVILCVGVVAVAMFFVLPKATVNIVLKAENIKEDLNITLSNKDSVAGVDSGVVLVNTLEISSDKRKEFRATGVKMLSEKATGEIIVYNECSTGPQTLMANTRFLSKEGKVFKVESGVTIPGFTKPEDAIIPGERRVKVVAEGAGESYNIGATSFTIPKLQELVSWKYSCLYARSVSPMTGGIEKEVTYVSQGDFDNAKDSLIADLKVENNQKMLNQENVDILIIDNEVGDSGKTSVHSSINVGGIANSFYLTADIKKNVLTVQRNEIEKYLSDSLLRKRTDSAYAVPVDGSLAYKIIEAKKIDNGITNIAVSASGDFVFKIREDEVRQAIAGKNEDEFKGYFKNLSGVNAVSINLWPFWVKKIPTDLNKINITIDIKDSV